jgi:hypothetical protein
LIEFQTGYACGPWRRKLVINTAVIMNTFGGEAEVLEAITSRIGKQCK